jgi:hypothetical protein
MTYRNIVEVGDVSAGTSILVRCVHQFFLSAMGVELTLLIPRKAEKPYQNKMVLQFMQNNAYSTHATPA